MSEKCLNLDPTKIFYLKPLTRTISKKFLNHIQTGAVVQSPPFEM